MGREILDLGKLKKKTNKQKREKGKEEFPHITQHHTYVCGIPVSAPFFILPFITKVENTSLNVKASFSLFPVRNFI